MSLPIVAPNGVTEQGDSQLVHWLLVLERSASVGDSVLTLAARLGPVVLCSVLRECTALTRIRRPTPPVLLELRLGGWAFGVPARCPLRIA